ncbi:MAG: hypothetical protein BGO10_02795 [Chlamydia sp. 32-24]|nr:MAG: hypothetical protein BGO10_02795 [Chlamydia sp. 32-24]
MTDIDENSLQLNNAQDIAILMHREAHFGGEFSIMLDYYSKEGKGVNPEFDLKRIEELAFLETQMKQNLAPLLLTGGDAERIYEIRQVYKKLKDLYETKSSKNENKKLIADLILSEDENPESEIKAIVEKKGEIIPELLAILKNEEYYDPLYPGYGQAPSLIAKCLGLIGDKRAIISIFEMIGYGDFFNDEILLESLKAIGDPAKNFLLKVLRGKPYNEDNERAAIALMAFKHDDEVANTALSILNDQEVLKDLSLSTYLILLCEGLQSDNSRQAFKDLYENPNTPIFLKNDMKAVITNWN